MVAGEVRLLTHARCNISNKQPPRRHTMSNHELIAWVNKQADAFESDMAETEDLDYAYANGAYMAYTLMLKQLVGTKYEVIKEKLWVADDGSWGSGDILIADVGTWTDEQVNAFDDIANNTDPSIVEVINILEDTKEVN
jgi:hypothetical protein